MKYFWTSSLYTKLGKISGHKWVFVCKPSYTYKSGDATAYLYGSLENDFYMKISEGFRVPEAQTSNSQELYSVKMKLIFV